MHQLTFTCVLHIFSDKIMDGIERNFLKSRVRNDSDEDGGTAGAASRDKDSSNDDA